MKYMCMNCGKIYEDKCLPIRQEGDGCCTIGSLIELSDELQESIYRLRDKWLNLLKKDENTDRHQREDNNNSK